MNTNVNNNDAQIQRMKALMGYGLNESSAPRYSSVEYGKKGADGKLYGVVREGASFYIKVAKNPEGGLISENFDYIGGFRHRGENKFNSFASAQRYLGEMLIGINESKDDARDRVIAEAWDLDAAKEVIEEGTKKMQAEINRQRQIMTNVQNISEGKKQCCDMPGCKCAEEEEVEEVKGGPGAPFNFKLTNKDFQETNIKDGKTKPVKESSEVPLTSREDPDYIDKTHGTKIGNDAPFVKKAEKIDGAVADAEGGEEEKSSMDEAVDMCDPHNQDKPTTGVGEKGDAKPFDEKTEVTEDVEIDDTLEDDVEDSEAIGDDIEGGIEGDAAVDDEEDEVLDDEEDTDDVDVELELDDDDEDDEDIEDELTDSDRIDALEDKLDAILNAIDALKYDDEPLYGNDEDEDDEFEDEEEYEVVESANFKRMFRNKNRINEDTFNDFGKHPAYQKVVMTTPPANLKPEDGDFEIDDDSVKSTEPFGIRKGNAKPFKYSAKEIDNAITESIKNVLKKK